MLLLFTILILYFIIFKNDNKKPSIIFNLDLGLDLA
jgi:hypothetical protein